MPLAKGGWLKEVIMPARLVFLLLSAILHAALLGVVFAFLKTPHSQPALVYQVNLVDALGPANPAGVGAPSGPTPPPVPKLEEPAPEPAKPEISKPAPQKNVVRPHPAAPAPKQEQAAPLQETPVPPQSPAPSSASPPAVAPGSAATPGGGGTGAPRQGPSLQPGGLLAYDADAVDTAPVISRRVTPEYPSRARRSRIQGQAVVRLIVDVAGLPQDCRIEEAHPAGYFEEAALAAARKTRFIPGQVAGRPVNTVVLVPFVFTLR